MPSSLARGHALPSVLVLRLLLGLLLCLLAQSAGPALAAGQDTSVPTAEAGRLPPRQVEVVGTDDAEAGIVAFSQRVVRFAADPGQDAQPELHLTSGVEGQVELALELRPVVGDGRGRPRPAETTGSAGSLDAATPSAVEWITLPARRVVLAEGEQARLWPTVTVPDDAPDGSHLAALTATAGEQTLVAFLVVDVGTDAQPPRVRVEVDLRSADRAVQVHMRTATEDVVGTVAGEIQVRGWPGWTAGTATLPELLILPGVPRADVVTFTEPLVPGRYVARAELASEGLELTATSSPRWLWDRRAAAVTAGLLLLATSVLVVLVWRGRRRTDAT